MVNREEATIITFIYVLITQIIPTFSSGPRSTPPPSSASTAAEPLANPANSAEPAATTSGPAKHGATSAKPNEPASAGVAATRLATTAASLDPTLDERAMLRTEGLVYSGNGRNIFSASSYVPEQMPTPQTHARPKGPELPPQPPQPLPPPPTCPPSCPPINLKFFGTATRSNGQRQAFLLDGEDVYLASQGDIVARKYKIASISSNSIQVEDLSNHNTQTLPLTSN